MGYERFFTPLKSLLGFFSVSSSTSLFTAKKHTNISPPTQTDPILPSAVFAKLSLEEKAQNLRKQNDYLRNYLKNPPTKLDKQTEQTLCHLIKATEEKLALYDERHVRRHSSYQRP